MTDASPFMRLDGDQSSLIFRCIGENVDLIYIGSRLPDDEDLGSYVLSQQYGTHENQPDKPPITGIFPQLRGGYDGPPAIDLIQNGKPIDPDFRLECFSGSGRQAIISWSDQISGLQITQSWEIKSSNMVRVATQLNHTDTHIVTIVRANILTLPLPGRFDQTTYFPGRWAKEVQETPAAIDGSILAMQSNAGKPGFEGGQWIILSDRKKRDQVGIHTSSLGNHHVQVFRDFDGRAVAQLAAVCQPGGIELTETGTINLGMVEFCYAPNADQMTDQFQEYIRKEILPDRANWISRKVHLNSWEALGFDLSEPALMQLADDAASLGAERLVLDDGWFKNRRNDRAGLGDWVVDKAIFPSGLNPLIDHVKSLDMDFGLWVEPEMVSPDSDLYRAHPDWCLHDEGGDRPTERNQLVLDLARTDVRSYIVAAFDALLEEHDIAYLKWDHNRRLFPDSGLQSDGVHFLLDHMRRQWRDVEVEICSSGGGRVSTAYLQYGHRVWPSDNNDPIERLPILKSWCRFLPLEVLGNHVGPSPNPITGRQTTMDFRAKIALFGHMGVEANPADMSDAERACLRAHIALYKEWRHLLHNGRYLHLHHNDPAIFAQMVIGDGQAIGIAAQTGFGRGFNVAPICLKGLDPAAYYHVSLPRPWSSKASHYLANVDQWNKGLQLSGQALMQQGLTLPLTHPETAWLFTLQRIDR